MENIRLRKVGIDQLKPAPYNPRLVLEPGDAGYERLERSMEEFQLVQPIVWNEQTGHVVSGHQRLNVLKNRGATEVEVAVVALSLEREKALNVTLNNRQVGSDWDYGKLTSLMTELVELPDFDETLTGFSSEEIRDFQMMPVEDFVSEPVEEDEEPRVQIHLELPVEQWDALEPELNTLIAKGDFEVHLQFPTSVG